MSSRYYHVAPAGARDSIFTSGLQPHTPDCDDFDDLFTQPEGVYLWDDLDTAHGYAVGCQHEDGMLRDVWEITGPVAVIEDEIVPSAWYTEHTIPADTLRLSPRTEWTYHQAT